MGQSNRSGFFVIGVLFGALVGAVAGVLFAPATGEESRKKVKSIIDEKLSKIKNADCYSSEPDEPEIGI